VLAGSIDEVLCATIERHLRGNANTLYLTSGSGTILERWADTLGVTYADGRITRSDVSSLRLQRGDLVLLYVSADFPVHVVVAAGDRQDVYSQWDRPQEYPVLADLGALWDSEVSNPAKFARLATPAWHA
jgi:hypothetical protein